MNTFSKILLDAERKTRDNAVIDKKDYIKDGILYCHKCNTPKQVKIDFLGEERTIFCACQCEIEKFEEEEKERKKRERFNKINTLRTETFPTRTFKNFTFANDDNSDSSLSETAQKYVENFEKMREEGKGLLLFGECDSGKTFIACCIANALIDKLYTVRFETLAHIVHIVQKDRDSQYLNDLLAYDLLVIDDLGAERQTEYMQEMVFNVINDRYNAKKPIIVTSNLTADEMKNPGNITAKRLYSRLYEMCFFKEAKSSHRRKKKNIDDFQKYREILAL